MLALILLVLFWAPGLPSSEPRVISEIKNGHVAYRVMIGTLANEAFASEASRFLAAKEIRLGAVVLYGSLRDRLIAAFRGGDHCSYDSWRLFMDHYGLSNDHCAHMEVQQALKVGSGIIVRTIERACFVRTRVIRARSESLEASCGADINMRCWS